MTVAKCSVNKIKVDFHKNRYYAKKNHIVEQSRKSGKKTNVAKFERQPGLLYFVKGNGVVGTAPMKNFKRKSSKKK